MSAAFPTSQVFAYGGPPAPWDYVPPPSNPWWPGGEPNPLPWRLDPVPTTAIQTLHICERCSRHVRLGEPCPFCMRDDIAALEKRLDEALKKETGALIRPKKRKKSKR